MIAFLTIIYTALVVVLFKLKLLKPRPFPIAWVVVAGVLLLGSIVVAWKLCAPLSPRLVTTRYVIQIVPYVKGQVKKVHARANQPVKKGDLLLEINPAPYQYKLDEVQSQLAASRGEVKQAKAGVEAADANVVKADAGINQAKAGVQQSKAALANAQAGLGKAKAGVGNAQAGLTKATASYDLAKSEAQIALNLQKMDKGAISTLRVTEAVQKRESAEAAVKQARAGVNEAGAAEQQAVAGVGQARAAELEAQAGLAAAESSRAQAAAAARQAVFTLGVAQSKVPGVEASLADARFNLDQCRVLAPTDGFVVDWQVQDGTMLVPMPMAPAGTFISTSETAVVASFPQNYLMNVQPGDDVEVVLDPYPGRLFKGKVDTVIEATGEGQFAPSGQIPQASKVGSAGMLAVKIRITDEEGMPDLPLGAGGTAAVYTREGKPVHIISKVTIRMKKWLLYVLPSAKS